jgi:hypothetical protein
MKTLAFAALAALTAASEGSNLVHANETDLPAIVYGGIDSEGVIGEFKFTDDVGADWYGYYIGWDNVWSEGNYIEGSMISNYVMKPSDTEPGKYNAVTCNVIYN